eukprot:10078_1
MPKHHKGEGSDERQLLGRPGNNVKIGIVGMPNVGKSTLFNILSNQQVPAENYPFCTIDPTNAKVAVPDDRFQFLCEHYKPKSRVQAALTVTDIAGLVKGAAEGQGLGNEFLSNISACDAIFHVVRAFSSKTIEHVEGNVDPVRDLEIISMELIAKDIESVKRTIHQRGRVAHSSKDKRVKDEYSCLEKVLAHLEAGKDVRSGTWTNAEVEFINPLLLLSAKSVVFLANVSLKNWEGKSGNKWLQAIKDWVKSRDPEAKIIFFCAEFEKKVQEADDVDAFYAEHGLTHKRQRSQIVKIIHEGYKTLHLIHFFTAGEDEVKCWTLKKGTKAKQAAGVIHTDFEKGFIKAETMAFVDFEEHGSEHDVKQAGRYMTNGKEYITKDGDIYLFKFNTPNK